MMQATSITRHAIGTAAIILALMVGAVAAPTSLASAADDAPEENTDGSKNMSAFRLPKSSLLSEKMRAAIKRPDDFWVNWFAAFKACPATKSTPPADMPAIRQCQADYVAKTQFYKTVRERYPVTMALQKIGGVDAEVFTPANGITRSNRRRVLINLHGSAFQVGARVTSQMESIPIAVLGRIKVVAVDYRMAPEYAYPAATDDVVAVYRELLKSYRPRNIGIYGCSAGALLAAQTLARLQKEGLPAPAAVGMFCEGAAYWTEGDSGYFAAAMAGQPDPRPERTTENPYFKNTDPNDPLAFPARSDEMLAKFPPSLLITSTRDLGMSSVVHTHSRLIALGVDARLHVWEGLDHRFFTDPLFPTSREVYDVIVKFFDNQLGK